MGPGSSPAMQALRRAQAAARYARRTGCGIDEASGVVAGQSAGPAGGEREGQARAGGGLSRRQVLRGAAGAGLAAAAPRASRPAAARAAARPGPRVVIVGSGIAGLGCAYRLRARHGIASEVYEYNAGRAGGRIHTLRGFFAGGQYAEEHGEFISSEHTAMRRLAAELRPHPGQRQRLSAAHPGRGLPVPLRRPVLDPGGPGPGVARLGIPAVP